MRFARIAGIVVSLFVASPLFADHSAAVKLRARGGDLAFNLHLDQAMAHYRQAVEADPSDPASYRAVAAANLMRIAFLRGAVTADEFLGGKVNADAIDMPKPPAELAADFRTHAERALQLAEQQVQAHPDDAHAHHQLGTAIGLLASYSAMIDGQVFAAFKLARRAYKEESRALELDPRRQDAGLILGVYEYVVSMRSLPVRWLARIGGMDSNKMHGIAMVEAAAQYPGENQADARVVLALIYNRERRYDDALKVLSSLQARYPDNRLLWLEAGGTALRARRYEDALRMLNDGFRKITKTSTARVFGEEALWYYRRGASLVNLNRYAEAAADLRRALKHEAREWVHGRVHTELGKIADLTGHRDLAREEYRIALQMAKAADDSIGREDAEKLLDKPHQ